MLMAWWWCGSNFVLAGGLTSRDVKMAARINEIAG